MKNRYAVLILDSQAETSLPFAQELGKIGAVVHAAAKSECLVFKSKYVSQAMVYPVVNNKKDFIDWVRLKDKIQNYDLIIPLTESMLEVLQYLDENDLLRKKSFLASRANVAVALDKMATSLLAKSLGIPVPDFVLLDESKAIGPPDVYPIVLKTLQSYVEIDGKNVYSPVCIASNIEERDRFLAKWLAYTSVQQQTYFRGHGWGVEFLYVNGVCVLHFCHQRIHELPLTGGASSYRRSVNAPAEMLNAGRMILDQLNWHGLAMVEFKMNEQGQFVLLEINPRPWGSLPLSVKAGVNFPVAMLKVVVGESLPKQPCYQVGYYARHFSRDLEWTKENFFADSNDQLLLTRSRFISVLEWGRIFVGRESWDHFDWADLAVFRSQMTTFGGKSLRAVWRRVAAGYDSMAIRYRHKKNRQALSASDRAITRVLFVCYGNICRSPVAEYTAKNLSSGIEYISTGFHEEVLRTTPENIIRIAGGLGLDLNSHRSCRISREQVLSADVIVVMDKSNFDDVLKEFPEAGNKIVLLGLFLKVGHLNISDPYALSDTDAADALLKVVSGVKGLVFWFSKLGRAAEGHH